MKIFPERNVKDCLVVIICICMDFMVFRGLLQTLFHFSSQSYQRKVGQGFLGSVFRIRQKWGLKMVK